MRRNGLWIVAMMCTWSSYAQAGERTRPADLSHADIAGVRIGMTKDEAVAAATFVLKVPKSAVSFEQSPAVNPVTNTAEPNYFSLEKGLVKLTVHMAPQIPRDTKNPMRVEMISYAMPWTPDNVKAMKEAAIQKYGSPSNGLIPAVSDWCNVPDKNPGMACEFDARNHRKLSLSGTELTLTDMSYHDALQDFMNMQNRVKPSF